MTVIALGPAGGPIGNMLVLQEADRGRDALAVQLVGEYLDQLRSPRTRASYRTDLTAWFAFLADRGVHPLVARRADVDAWVTAMGDPGPAARAPRTISRRLSAVSGFYAHALDEEAVAGNPVARVKRPKVDDEVELGLDLMQVQALLDAAGQHRTVAGRHRAVALITVLLLTGLRVGELLALDVEQLDSDRGHRVLRNVRRKGGKTRTIVLVAVAAAALDDLLAGRTTGPLFATATGARWSTRAARRVWASAAQRAQLPARLRHPHVARHTFCTLLLDAGEQLAAVQDALDHADPATTRRYDRRRAAVSAAHPSYRLASLLAER